MEHVVFFTAPDRSPQFRRTPSLDEAVRFVESLRNGEGIDDSLVYALTEVPLRFQTYYRVEVPTDVPAPALSSPQPPAPQPPAAQTPSPQPPAAPEPASAELQAEAAPDSTFSEPVQELVAEPAPSFEPVAVETLPPPPPVENLEPQPVPDLLNGDEAESADGANGKPHRGLGFFAR
ncbi:MAG TPA: hypothetical protein VNA14_04170 [Mycobacteriales bacterium]|nr:hypothetical protein [Mycobacteriales bacterium]